MLSRLAMAKESPIGAHSSATVVHATRTRSALSVLLQEEGKLLQKGVVENSVESRPR
jgi:hypothetical protein